MKRYVYTTFFILAGALAAPSSAQQLDITSCSPEGDFYRCLSSDGRPVFLKPDEYEMVRQAIAMGAVVEPTSPTASVAPQKMAPHAKPQSSTSLPGASVDIAALTDALNSIIQSDARGWMFNRYDSGSVRNVKVTDRSQDGRSMVVYGDYSFNGGRSGNVQVLIRDGEVECLQFWDSPSCRPLGRSHSQALVAAAVVGAMTSDNNTSNDRSNCQLERIGGQVQEICY